MSISQSSSDESSVLSLQPSKCGRRSNNSPLQTREEISGCRPALPSFIRLLQIFRVLNYWCKTSFSIKLWAYTVVTTFGTLWSRYRPAVICSVIAPMEDQLFSCLGFAVFRTFQKHTKGPQCLLMFLYNKNDTKQPWKQKDATWTAVYFRALIFHHCFENKVSWIKWFLSAARWRNSHVQRHIWILTRAWTWAKVQTFPIVSRLVPVQVCCLKAGTEAYPDREEPWTLRRAPCLTAGAWAQTWTNSARSGWAWTGCSPGTRPWNETPAPSRAASGRIRPGPLLQKQRTDAGLPCLPQWDLGQASSWPLGQLRLFFIPEELGWVGSAVGHLWVEESPCQKDATAKLLVWSVSTQTAWSETYIITWWRRYCWVTWWDS